ncbi:MAG: hypothetical protein H6747_09640 [Deltaproteobacteria bacterium]|nr:hypothetical protein [Deltaproteobacteria bacterium]
MAELAVDLMEVFAPYEAQARVLAARQRYLLFLGGIAAGKTSCGAMWALAKALGEAETDGLVVGRTERNDAIGLLWARIRALLTKLSDQTGVNWIRKWDAQNNRLTLLNGSTISFRAYSQPDKLLGHEYAWAWIDELSAAGESVDPLYVLDLIDGRLRGVAGKNKQILISMTARGLDPVAARFQDAQRRQDPRHFVVKATSYSNPYTPREDLEAWVASMSARRVKQEIYCVLLRPQTAVWPEFDPRVHCIDVKRAEFKTWHHVCGLDWGATRGSVALEVRVHPQTRQWVVVDELIPRPEDYKDGVVNRQRFRDALKAWWSEKNRGYPEIIVSDRAIVSENMWLRNLAAKHSPSTSVRTLVTREEQARFNGTEAIRDLLDPAVGDRPRLLFSSSLDRNAVGASDGGTPGVVSSMTNLSWATDKLGRPMNYVPDMQVWRDSTDALRYAVVGCRNVRHLWSVLPRWVGVGELESEAA